MTPHPLHALLLLPALTAQARPVNSPSQAKAIAEHDTGGIAVSARRIHLNGATGGWEVDLHLPGEKRGWRCVVDSDTHTVYTKTRIPNPEPPRRRR